MIHEGSDLQRPPSASRKLSCCRPLQIETETGNKTVSNLERILEDYRAVRQENSALAAKVREA